MTLVPAPSVDRTLACPPRAGAGPRSLESRSVGYVVGFEAHTIVGHLEPQPAVAVGEADGRTRRVRIFRHVLQRLEAREVDGRFDLRG